MVSRHRRLTVLWFVLGIGLISAPAAFGDSQCPSFPYECHLHCTQEGCFRDAECDNEGICVYTEYFSWDEIVIVWQVKALGLQAVSPGPSAPPPGAYPPPGSLPPAAPAESPAGMRPVRPPTPSPARPPAEPQASPQTAGEQKLRTIVTESATIRPGLVARGAPPKPTVFWECGKKCLACAGKECEFMVNACNQSSGGVGFYDPNAQVGVCGTGTHN